MRYPRAYSPLMTNFSLKADNRRSSGCLTSATLVYSLRRQSISEALYSLSLYKPHECRTAKVCIWGIISPTALFKVLCRHIISLKLVQPALGTAQTITRWASSTRRWSKTSGLNSVKTRHFRHARCAVRRRSLMLQTVTCGVSGGILDV